VVSLFESGLSETFPTVRSVNIPSSFKGNIEVTALDGKVEPSALVLHKMQCDLLQDVRSIESFEKLVATNLWVPLLL